MKRDRKNLRKMKLSLSFLSVCLSVCPHATTRLPSTGRIHLKLYIGGFASLSITLMVDQYRREITDTSHGDLGAFMSSVYILSVHLCHHSIYWR